MGWKFGCKWFIKEGLPGESCQRVRKHIREGAEPMGEGASLGERCPPTLTHRELCRVIRMGQGSWAFPLLHQWGWQRIEKGNLQVPLTQSSSPSLRLFSEWTESPCRQLGAKHTEARGGVYRYGSRDPVGSGEADSVSNDICVYHPLILSAFLWRWYYAFPFEAFMKARSHAAHPLLVPA